MVIAHFFLLCVESDAFRQQALALEAKGAPWQFKAHHENALVNLGRSLTERVLANESVD
jgi:hypothetical protein